MQLRTQTHLKALRDALVYRLHELGTEVDAAGALARGNPVASAGEVSDRKDAAATWQATTVGAAEERRDLDEIVGIRAALRRLDEVYTVTARHAESRSRGNACSSSPPRSAARPASRRSRRERGPTLHSSAAGPRQPVLSCPHPSMPCRGAAFFVALSTRGRLAWHRLRRLLRGDLRLSLPGHRRPAARRRRRPARRRALVAQRRGELRARERFVDLDTGRVRH